MKIEDIKILLDVIREKSFTEAGIINGYSQSTISKKINKLEEELETKLLYRNKKEEILPTTKEQNLHNKFEKIIELYNDIIKTTKQNIIKIGFSTGYSERNIIKIIEKLKETSIETQVEINNSENLYQKVKENKLDGAIIGINKKDETLHIEKYTEEQIILAGIKYIKDFNKNKLYETPLILHQKGSGLREFVIKELEKMNINTSQLQIKYEIGYEEFCIETAKKKYGYTFVSKDKLKLPLQKIWAPEELKRNFYIISKEEKIIKLLKE